VRPSSGSVLLLTDARIDAHSVPGHPEHPARRDAAAAGVRDAAADRLVEEVPEPATDAELERVHDAGYIALLTDAEARGGGWLDPDTFLVPGSLLAARLAAGATLRAARAAVAGEAAVAVAAVRPPGHHARRDRGSGFCLFNNVAVALAGLRADGAARRVAIVDWDVHHGDGTQAIVQGERELIYASTHQYPFYPGTGAAADDGGGVARNHQLLAGDGDDAFVAAWRDELLPAVEEFRPEAILVSAGYDAHAADPLAELAVTEAGYEAVGRAVGELAGRLEIPGVALTLEGGYDLDALRASVAASVRGVLAGRSPA
jgi:acetoin utilization deacetylase AcuC-like enzyme